MYVDVCVCVCVINLKGDLWWHSASLQSYNVISGVKNDAQCNAPMARYI